MTRTAKINPVDICILHVKPKRPADSSLVSRKFSTIVARPEYDNIRDLAMDVFTAVGYAKSDCPEVWLDGDCTIRLLWSEDDRFLHVQISQSRVVSYYVAKTKTEVPTWNVLSNINNVDEVMFKLGRYIIGSIETDCGERRIKL